MNNKNIFTDTTLKLKTKVIIFSGLSLFIGITEILPKKLVLFGLDFEKNERVLGWFLIIITLYLFIHFILIAILDMRIYFQNHLLDSKIKSLSGDTIGLNMSEISGAYELQQSEHHHDSLDESRGTLYGESEDIQNKSKKLYDTFNSKHIQMYEKIELFFYFITPLLLGMVSMYYLFRFLIK